MNNQTKIELEAAAFRKLLEHLQKRTDVQNIDLMNLAGFCRNCLSKWVAGAAEEKNIEFDYATACEMVYGMPYADWKANYQLPATDAQLSAFKAISKDQITE